MSKSMKGTVKWFSQEKGYGFICGEDGVDRFVHVRDIQGAELPVNGAKVEFVHEDGPRGPRALQVQIQDVAGPNSAGKKTNSVTCSGCGRQMAPRVITGRPELYGRNWHPVPIKSICPFCGDTYKEFDSSFGSKRNEESFYFGLIKGVVTFAIILAGFIWLAG